ncbi:MAG: JAB domain-containing protein [Desulfosporosinus sp.]
MEQMSLLNQYDIDKDQFVELFSKFIGLSKTKIYKFLEDNPIRTLFEHPTSLNATESQIKKIDQLKELRNLYHNLKSQDKVYTINSSQKAGEYFKEYFADTKDKERFACSFLDNSNRIIATKVISTGTINQAPVFPREILKSALLYDSSSVILAHNHPRGSMSPSPEDITVTKLIGDALATIKISVTDHIIVGDDSFTSFAEKGLAFTSNDNTVFKEQKDSVKPQNMAERMVAAKEAAKERSAVQKQDGDPEKDKGHNKEREAR